MNMGSAPKMGDLVKIIISGESGFVIGRKQVLGSSDEFLVRYVDGAGCAVERWWKAKALTLPANIEATTNIEATIGTNIVPLRAVN